MRAITYTRHGDGSMLYFPLEDTAAAHTAVEQGAVGKVLITVGV